MKERWLPFLLPAILLAVWQILGSVGWLSSRWLPTPWAVLHAAIVMTQSGELVKHMLVSTQRAAIGFLIGGSIGFGLGILTGTFRSAELVFDSSLQMLRNIPHLALLPLVILWFGVDEIAKVFLVSLGVMFPIYLNTYHGVRSIDQSLIEMGRVYGLSNWRLFGTYICREPCLPS